MTIEAVHERELIAAVKAAPTKKAAWIAIVAWIDLHHVGMDDLPSSTAKAIYEALQEKSPQRLH